MSGFAPVMPSWMPRLRTSPLTSIFWRFKVDPMSTPML